MIAYASRTGTRHIVLYSGGIASWRVAQLVIERHGAAAVTLLFADTKSEDEDTYRFLTETAADFGAHLEVIADGRDVWQVFNDVRYIGNTRIDPCSNLLKRVPTRRWLSENCDPQSTVVYIGFDMFEEHRFTRASKHWTPWTIEAPLLGTYETKPVIAAMLEARGIKRPRLYDQGFAHNNCRGACVKAGVGQWKHLLDVNRAEYLRQEGEEEALRARLGRDVSILRDQTGGETTPLTLAELRRRVEAEEQIDLLDWRGCGCFGGSDQDAV